MEMTLIFPRCVSSRVLFSGLLKKKRKKWSVSENPLLTYGIAEEVGQLSNRKQFHISQLSCCIGAFSDSFKLWPVLTRKSEMKNCEIIWFCFEG